MMWSFWSSSSAEAASDAQAANPADEESTMEAPQKSYSAMHDIGNASGEMNGTSCGQADSSKSSTAAAACNGMCNAGGGTGPTIIPLPTQKNYQANGKHERLSTGPSTPRKRRGIIYFRRITPSDRKIIQTLHEKWFPVDYKPDFFDTLCNNTERLKMPGLNNCEPLYSCVACFKELDEDEFEYRRRKRREWEERKASWSFWSGKRPCGNDGVEDGADDDEYGADSLLWELEEDSMKNDRTAGHGSTGDSGSSYQDAATTSDRSVRFQHPPATPISNGALAADDIIESGESALSIHHRTERERLRRFYSNGFRHDSSDSRACNNHDWSNETSNRNSGGKQQMESSNHSSSSASSTEGPYYNDEGEQIVGCIVGSFLPSSMLANRHKSTLDEKPKRDETAQLLVPDCERYTKMFYIMTLGTTREFRRCGLGSILVERVVDMIEGRRECGALYLHVIIYNEGAMRLYERLGFARVKEIKDYYTINGVNYDCYLYARYFHGNRGHKSTFGVLYDMATHLARKITHTLLS